MRLTARLFLPFLMLWLAVMPIRSYGFAFLAAPIMVAGLNTGAIAALEQIAVGAGVVALGYSFNQATGGSISTLPFAFKTNPNDRLQVPTGWTPSTSSSVQPTPPPSATVKSQFSTSGVRMYDTISNAALDLQNLRDYFGGCSGTFPAISCTSQPYVVSCSATSCIVAGPNNVGSIFQTTIPVSNFSICPAGYTASGSTCALSNASQVIKPAGTPCEILRTGNTFAPDLQNPACQGIGANPQLAADGTSIVMGSSSATISNRDGRTAVATINPDGTLTIVTSTPSGTSSSTTTTTNTTAISAPAAGTGATVVTGQATTTTQGVGSLGTTAPATPAANITVNVPPLVLPTDYNREATQGQIAASSKSTADALAVPVSIAPAQTALTDAISAASSVTGMVPTVADMEGLQTSIPWVAWLNPFTPSACTPFTYTLLGKVITWDFCAKIAILSDVLGWMMTVYTAWELQSLVFRRSA